MKSLFFVEEGQGRDSEDIKKECNAKCFGFFCLFDGHHGWKNHNKLTRTALNQKKKKHLQTEKVLEAQ